MSPPSQVMPRAETLRLWQRFHFRLTMLYGGVVLLLLALMGGSEAAGEGLDDPAARYQVDRCRSLDESPPSSKWTGVARLRK